MSLRAAALATLRRRSQRVEGAARRLLHQPRNAEAVRVYDLMRSDNASAPEAYQAGAFWAAINRDFRDLIWTDALESLRNQYFNRRFSGPDPADRQVYRALLRLYLRYLEPLDARGFLKSHGEPPVGGRSDQEIIDGRAVSLDFLQSVDEAFAIERAWARIRERPPELFVELGAGYGRLAYAVRKLFPSATYVVVDLPEALTCASSWLSRALPGEVVPYVESRKQARFTRADLTARKVWTLGAHQLESIEDGSVDVFVNIYSFAEMPPASIGAYFRNIDRLVRGLFFTKQRKHEDNRVDGVVVTSASYPIPPTWRRLFERDTTLYPDFFEAGWEIGAGAREPLATA